MCDEVEWSERMRVADLLRDGVLAVRKARERGQAGCCWRVGEREEHEHRAIWCVCVMRVGMGMSAEGAFFYTFLVHSLT